MIRHLVDKKALAREYRAGATCAELAARHNLTPPTVNRILHDVGEPLRPRNRRKGKRFTHPVTDHLDAKLIAKQYRSGKSLRVLGEMHNCSFGSISRVLKEQGVKMRRVGRQY